MICSIASRPDVALAPDGEADGITSRCPPEIGLLCPGIGDRVVLPEVFLIDEPSNPVPM